MRQDDHEDEPHHEEHHLLEGDFDGALTLLNEADRAYAGDYNPNVRPVPAVAGGGLSPTRAWMLERLHEPLCMA